MTWSSSSVVVVVAPLPRPVAFLRLDRATAIVARRASSRKYRNRRSSSSARRICVEYARLNAGVSEFRS